MNKYLCYLKDGRQFVVTVPGHCLFRVMNARIIAQLSLDVPGFKPKDLKSWESDF